MKTVIHSRAARHRKGNPAPAITLYQRWQRDAAVDAYRELRRDGMRPATARHIVWSLLFAGRTAARHGWGDQ